MNTSHVTRYHVSVAQRSARRWWSAGGHGGCLEVTACVNVNTTDATTARPVLRHCYCPLRIHTPYMTPYVYVSGGALAWCPLHTRRAVLHDLHAAVSGRFCRGRCARPPPPLTSRAVIGRGSGRTAGRYASAARAFISPTAFEQARGGALGAGGGRVGFAGGGLF